MKMYDVFISYRRSDGSAAAQAIAAYLSAKGLQVFFDKNEIKDSQDFKVRIETSLRQAPNYLLVASTAAFQFYTDQQDWVRREMEIACEHYDGNSGDGRMITVVVPQGAQVPREEDLPENIRCLANPNRIELAGQLPDEEEYSRIRKAVTLVGRHNLWNAGCRWLEESKRSGGRFSALDINASLFPNASKQERRAYGKRKFPIFVQPQSSKRSVPLMEALAENTDHVYLIGQGGIGKTTTLVHLMDEAYGEGRSYGENCRIPLFVSLSAAPDTGGELYKGGKSTFICRSIYKQVREDRTPERFHRQKSGELDEAFTVDAETAVVPVMDLLSRQTDAPEYILLLDGLNEVSRNQIEEVDRSVIQMILEEINRLMASCPNVRLVITGRADETMVRGERLTRLELSGLKEPVIRQYLADCACLEERIEKVFQNDELLETLKVPLFLVMYANLRNHDEITTRGEILRTFFNENKEELRVYTAQSRLAQVEDDVENAAGSVQKLRLTAEMQCFILDFLLPEIAWYMEQRDLFSLDDESIGEVIAPVLMGRDDAAVCGRYGKQVFTKYRGCSAKAHTRNTAKAILTRLGGDMEDVTETLIDCCRFSMGLLTIDGSKYGFVHQHIRDYFAAQKVINQLWLAVCLYDSGQEDTAFECLGTVLGDAPLGLTLRRFVGEALGEHKNKPQFLAGKWCDMVPEELCGESLIRNALNILRGRACGGDYILNNLIHIIDEVRTELSGEDLSGLDFSNCSLNGKRLSRMDLVASLRSAVIKKKSLFPQDHTDLITGGSFSSDPGIFITASRDGVMKIWDIKTSACVRTVPAHQAGLSDYFHNPSRCLIVTLGNDGIKYWHDASLEWIKTIPIPDSEIVRHGEMCPNGKYITYLTREYGQTDVFTIRILDVDAAQHIEQIRFEKGCLQRAMLCEDERHVLVAYEPEMPDQAERQDRVFELYDRQTNTWTELNAYSAWGDLAICENMGYLVIQNPNRLRLVDPVKKRTVLDAEIGSSKIFRYCISEDGVLFTAAHSGETRFWDLASGTVIAGYQASGFDAYQGDICRKRCQYALNAGDELLIYDYKHEKALSRLKSFWLRVQSAAFSRDGEKLLISSGNEVVQIWEREKGQYRCRTMPLRDRGDFMFAEWTKNGTHFLVTYRTKHRWFRIQHYHAATGQLLWSKDLARVQSSWHCPDCNAVFLVTKDNKASGKEIVIAKYDLDTMEQLQTWTFPEDYDVGCIRPDGGQFVLDFRRSRQDKAHIARVYDARSCSFIGEIQTDEFIGSYRYAPDGAQILAVADEEQIHVYDGRTCALVRVLSNQSLGRTFDMRCDGSQLASAENGMVHIWDVATMERRCTIHHPARWITKVEYSPDGKMLISAASGGTVFICNTDTYQSIQEIPNIPGLFIQGVDLRELAPASDMTEEEKQILRTYGAWIG